MFEYMLEDNKDLMASFEEYLDLKDVTFIKELIQGVGVCKLLCILYRNELKIMYIGTA